MLNALRQAMAGGTGRRVAWMFGTLLLANLLLWAASLAVFRHYPLLLGTCMLAYGFGLRHAVDADHIAAIDNVTRKLMQQGKRPIGVGLYFSLGHSSIVVALSAAVAVSALAVKRHFPALADWGGVLGTGMSALFLLGIAGMNLFILAALIGCFRRVRAGGEFPRDDVDLLLARRGFFSRIFRRLFGLVTQSWHMVLVGFLFGLGFDTATEVGLLGISATSASQGLPVWSILLFPALFTAGMALVDTADSVLMLGAYGWALMQPMRRLFYNITITAISAAVAVLVGGLECLGLVQSSFKLSGMFWDQIAMLSGDAIFGMLGYGVIGVFILAWALSTAIYKFKRYAEIELTAAN